MTRSATISLTYATLHWLNIEQRIHFKILVTVFKCINSMAPAPLSNLLVIKDPTDMTLVTKLFFSSSPFGDCAFVYYAPRHWNALPRPIRIITSLKVFKGKVKNHLLTSFPCFLKATKMYSSPPPWLLKLSTHLWLPDKASRSSSFYLSFLLIFITLLHRFAHYLLIIVNYFMFNPRTTLFWQYCFKIHSSFLVLRLCKD